MRGKKHEKRLNDPSVVKQRSNGPVLVGDGLMWTGYVG